jgi:LmbE family N-acetylglucosaminyl deacetylase
VRPQRVVTHSPERNYARIYASHPDHLAVGEAALCAVYPDARNPFTHTELLADEGLAEWAVPEVWLMATEADRWVDVTDTYDAKLSALRAHVSQTAHMDDLDDRIRGWLTAQATAAGLPDGRLAEAFRVVDTA